MRTFFFWGAFMYRLARQYEKWNEKWPCCRWREKEKGKVGKYSWLQLTCRMISVSLTRPKKNEKIPHLTWWWRECDRNHEWADEHCLRSEFTRGININRKWINSFRFSDIFFSSSFFSSTARNFIFHLNGCNLIFYSDCLSGGVFIRSVTRSLTFLKKIFDK